MTEYPPSAEDPGLSGRDGVYTIVARVIRQEGHCAAGHRVGDEILFDGQTVQGKAVIAPPSLL